MRPIHFTLPILLIITVLTSACGSTATPTIAATDVQNTAMAAAFTIVAETHAAVPTNTAVPPTETPTKTPTPTETPVVLPSEAATPTATQVAGNADPCNAPLQSISGGNPTKIRIDNETGAPITLSLYLNKTPFGDCGYRGYSIGKAGSILITDLIQGCYNVSVFINDPKKPAKSFGYGCINNPDKWTFIVSRENVLLQGR